MRILLSTIHGSDNYGAVLQATCLARVLADQGSVSVLNHRPVILNAGYLQDCLPFQVLRKRVNPEFPSFIRKHVAMRRTQRALLPLTQPVRRSPSERDYADYDAAVVGSDEVWSDLWGAQEQFFFAKAPDSVRRIAYAASAGRSERFDSGAEVRTELDQFHTVLVRDRRTADVCDALGRPADEVVCDPVMLIDPDRLRSMAVPVSTTRSPYTLVYAESCRADDGVETLRRAAGGPEHLVSVGFPYPGAESRIAADLGEFLGLMDGASLVITTMFHGVVTGLALGKPVAVIQHPAKRAKVTDLLDQIDATVDRPEEHLAIIEETPGVDAFRARSHRALAAALD